MPLSYLEGKTAFPPKLLNGWLPHGLLTTSKFRTNEKAVFQSPVCVATSPPISLVGQDQIDHTTLWSPLNFQTYRNIKFLYLSLCRQFGKKLVDSYRGLVWAFSMLEKRIKVDTLLSWHDKRKNQIPGDNQDMLFKKYTSRKFLYSKTPDFAPKYHFVSRWTNIKRSE